MRLEIELDLIGDSLQMSYVWMGWNWTQFKLSWPQPLKFWADWTGYLCLGSFLTPLMLLFNWRVNDEAMHVLLGYDYVDVRTWWSKVMEGRKELSCVSY